MRGLPRPRDNEIVSPHAQFGVTFASRSEADRSEFRENVIEEATEWNPKVKMYRALATLPNLGQTPVTIEARTSYEAKAKLEPSTALAR